MTCKIPKRHDTKDHDMSCMGVRKRPTAIAFITSSGTVALFMDNMTPEERLTMADVFGVDSEDIVVAFIDPFGEVDFEGDDYELACEAWSELETGMYMASRSTVA